MSANSMTELYAYALTFYGTPYQWGGGHDGPLNTEYGLDCSGYLRKLLAYASVPPKGDQTADDYYHWFLGNGHLNTFGLGAIAFFGTTAKIHHVGFCIDDKIMISAGGGGSHVTNLNKARTLSAFIKIEPLNLRKDFVCCIMPFYQLPLHG